LTRGGAITWRQRLAHLPRSPVTLSGAFIHYAPPISFADPDHTRRPSY